jgi:hypothetical protein
MTDARHSLAAAALIGVALAGCGGSTSQTIAPAARVEHVPGSPADRIVLSAAGAQRIGIQTAPARGVPHESTVTIPFSAVVYDPSGATYAFTSPAPLTFTEVPIAIDHIDGDTAYLRSGPPAGTEVVTVGAEELYGVQTGVQAQT